MGITKIGKISRVVSGKPSGDQGPLSTQPGDPSSSSPGIPMPGQTGSGSGMPSPKGTPKTVVLRPEDRLTQAVIDRIEEMIKKGDDWNIGGTNPGQGAIPMPGEGPEIEMPPIDEPDGEDTREWNKTPGQMDQEIDRAIKAGIEEQRKAEREGKIDSEKTMGGSGRGGVRDRLQIKMASQTDWAKIFESRLTEYSREASKYLPYHRRFVSNPRMRTRIPSRIQEKDVLPEMNLIIDTSSSLSYRELEVILSEIRKALQSAKMSKINVVLWASDPYWHKSYEDVSGAKFEKVIDDIQANWEGGGNDTAALYELIKSKGWSKKFSIHLTDGYIDDHFSKGSRVAKLSAEVFDPNNTIFGIIYPKQKISYDQFKGIMDRFPGEKVPIFLDTSKFY
jgi:hypothetical protein